MEINVLVDELKKLRIMQKERLHIKEAKEWLREFPDVRISKEYEKEIKLYWKQYGVNPSLAWYKFYLGCTGIEDPKFLGNDIYYSRVIFRLNRFDLSAAYDNKNGYDMLFRNRVKMPVTIARNMNGCWRDADYNAISVNEVKKRIMSEEKCIVKPTMGTSGGKGIIVLNNVENNKYYNSVKRVLTKKDIIIQKFIKQNIYCHSFNSTSINTVRVFSFLWKEEVHILTTYFRVGNDKKEFVECHTWLLKVNDNGTFGKVINDHDFHRKPCNHHKFVNLCKNTTLPSIKEILTIVKREHKKLSYFGLIGWDFAVDDSGEPILIEINTQWPALDHVQMLSGPAFGDLTSSVMSYVFSDKQKLKRSIYLGI